MSTLHIPPNLVSDVMEEMEDDYYTLAFLHEMLNNLDKYKAEIREEIDRRYQSLLEEMTCPECGEGMYETLAPFKSEFHGSVKTSYEVTYKCSSCDFSEYMGVR